MTNDFVLFSILLNILHTIAYKSNVYIHKVPFIQQLTPAITKMFNTVKPVCNDHLYDKIYYLWFIQ